jgi:hypothetical protein
VQGLTPIILATQEAEIRRITIPSQLAQIVCEILSSQKNLHKKGLVGCLKWSEHLPSKHEALSSNPNAAKKLQM